MIENCSSKTLRFAAMVALWFRKTNNLDSSTGQLASLIARSLACTAHSFAYSAMLASLACSAALIRSFTPSLTHSLAGRNVYDLMSQNDLVVSHSVEFRLSALNGSQTKGEREALF